MKPFCVSDSSLIVRAADLAPFRRGGRWLILVPRTGASVLLEGPRLKLFGALARPVSVQKVYELSPDLAEDEIQALLGEFHRAGMLQIVGYPLEEPERPEPLRVHMPRLTLRVTAGCSPSCPKCALQYAEGATLEPAQAVGLVEEGLQALAPGPVCLDLTGAEPLRVPATIEAAIQRARELRPTAQVAVRTGGYLLDSHLAGCLERQGVCVVLCLHEAPGRAGLEQGPLADFAVEALRLLPSALATGLSCAPVGVARRPGQALEFFHLFMSMGYRTMRLEFPAPPRQRSDRDQVLDGMAGELLAVADAVACHEERVPVRVRVHPLEEMFSRLASGKPRPACGHLECGARVAALERGIESPRDCAEADQAAAETNPRCLRCPFWTLCGGGCRFQRGDHELDLRCRMWLKAYEGLLWRAHENPDWAGRHWSDF
jgi:hypothetical protein